MKNKNPLRRARVYLEKRADLNTRPLEVGDTSGVRQVVVIPALAEQGWLYETLSSLTRNDAETLAHTLVICVVNNRAAPWAGPEEIEDNQRTLKRLREAFAGADGLRGFGKLRLGIVDASSAGLEIDSGSGVGEARRIGMDHALDVLCENNHPHGPLMCLDADSPVAPDYLLRVEDFFEIPDSWAAVVAYEHPLPEDPQQCRAIVLYEVFLRYHELGLRYAESPYAFPTIGSTMVARADAYVAVGGMNRRQAAEDFYFLQQLYKTGGVGRIDATRVYPSARPSGRVPFGTGATVARSLSGDRRIETVYDPMVYRVIARWLRVVRAGLGLDASDLLHEASVVDPHLTHFLLDCGFEKAWPRLKANASGRAALEAQFHRWFDAFRSLKLIHYLRDIGIGEAPIFDACRQLLERGGVDVGSIDWADIDREPAEQLRLLQLMREVCAS